MKSISLWHKFSVISMILCQPCWIQLIYHRKSLRSKLIRDVSKASSTVIEEWWINVHAFDLAGLVLSNRFPFSRSVPFPTIGLFLLFSFTAFNPFLILYFILLLQSFQVPRRIHTIIDINLSASLLLFSPSNFVIREEIFHVIFFTFLPVKTSTRESWYFSFSFVSTNNPRLI